MTSLQKGAGREIAIVGGGCFWCTEAVFNDVEGVLSVAPGYMGGKTESPSYRDVCNGGTGHAEVIRIEFDPAVLSFREVLEIFFVVHDPTTLNRQGNDIGTQYRSAIFTITDQQMHDARALIDEMSAQGVFSSAIVTQVEPAGRFWPAEDYHHDYYAKNPDQPYCQYVVAPKLSKFREKFSARRKRGG